MSSLGGGWGGGKRKIHGSGGKKRKRERAKGAGKATGTGKIKPWKANLPNIPRPLCETWTGGEWYKSAKANQ